MVTQRYKITKSFVDSVPLSPDKPIIYRDSEITGFGLRVGGVKSFVAEKKMPNGSPCRVNIGKYGVWTVAQARERARELLIMMSNGINPNQEKSNRSQQAKAGYAIDKSIPTLSQAYDFYKSKKVLSENTIRDYDTCVDDYFNDWQHFQLNAITKKMVLERHAELSTRSLARANLAIKFLRALINFTLLKNIDDDGNRLFTFENPVSIINEQKALNKIKRRRTYIRADQLNDWAHAVVTSEWPGEQSNDYRAYTNQDYILLLALTGFRRSEGESILWQNVDLRFGTITIKDTKNGEDLTLPMGSVLWHILKQRHKHAINEYVFADRTGKTCISDRRDARRKITESSGIEFTFHDLRRTFSSVANSLAIGGYTIKRLINHTFEDDDNDVTDGYVQVSFEDMRNAMNMIEDKILSKSVQNLIFNRI